MRLLYISTHNVSRSIIAESVTRRLGEPRFKVMSCGTDPQEDINPVAHRMLKQFRYISTNLVSKSWDRFSNWQPDIVITLSNEVLRKPGPAYLKTALHIHWPLPDPITQEGNMEQNFTDLINIFEKRIKIVLDQDIENMDKTQLRTLFKKAADDQ